MTRRTSGPARGDAREDATTQPVEVPSEGTARRRRLGFGLALFGATGLLLFGVGLAWAGGLLDGTDGPLGLEGQRRQLVAMLEASGTAIADAERAVAAANASLTDTAASAGSAGTFMTGLGTSLRGAATALRVDLLGSRPFATAADDFERVADQAAALATDLAATGESVTAASTEMAVLADDLGELRREMDAIRERLAGPIDVATWRLLAAAVLIWFAIPAAVSLVIGLRWLRSPADAGRPRAERSRPARRLRPPAGRRARHRVG